MAEAKQNYGTSSIIPHVHRNLPGPTVTAYAKYLFIFKLLIRHFGFSEHPLPQKP